MQVVTAVAADDLERVPVAAFPTAIQGADRLAPDARRHAMPKLTSQRDSHNITELNAGPQITGMAPMPHADALRTVRRRDTGHDMRSFGAQHNPTSSRLGHRRGLEQRYAICQYRHQILRRQVPT
jgi:hypothetical protein